MNGGQHRKPSSVIGFLKRKPVQFLGFGVLALFILAVSSPPGKSYATFTAQGLHIGSDVPLSYAGQVDVATDGISGGTALWPQQGSTALPTQYQGGFSQAKFYVDTAGLLYGGDGSKVGAHLLHFDITRDSAGNQRSSLNGYLSVEDSEIPNWLNDVDGYEMASADGYQTAQKTAFDQFITSQVLKQTEIYATTKRGANQFTVYDLSNFMEIVGGGFTGQHVGPATTEGPYMVWTKAPQAQVSLPAQSTITPGGTVKFYGEAGIESLHDSYHYEWAQVVDSNGQIVPGATVTFYNNLGTNGGLTGNGVYTDPTQPQSQDKMTEMNGGNSDPPTTSPVMKYWIDGNGEPSGWGTGKSAIDQTSAYDTIKLPSTITPGTYTIQYYVADWYNRVSSMATATFTVGQPVNNGITLTASNTTPNVGQSVTLTANVTKAPPAGDTYHIEIYNENGSTLNGSSTRDSGNNVTTFSTSAVSQTVITENYIAYLVDTTTGNSIKSNEVTVTWSSGGGSGGGGLCPAPYDKNIYWQSNGNGNETLHWTYDVPYAVYRTVRDCSGTGKNRTCDTYQVFDHCADKLTPMQQYYPASETQGNISGLSYDPGVPGNMWLPIPASQWGTQASGSGFWAPMDQQHGWDGFEGGGPNASQISGTANINGITYHTYGTGQGSTPWAWARPASSFGFRMLWTGSPHSLPTNGTVTYTLTNPDGQSKTWTEPLIINSETLQTQGTQMVGLNQPPPFADEVFSAAVKMIPKTVGSGNELAAWSLSGNSGTAFANGAHVSVQINFGTQNAGNINVDVPSMVALYNYPAWFFNHTSSVTIGGTTYTGTGSAQDGP